MHSKNSPLYVSLTIEPVTSVLTRSLNYWAGVLFLATLGPAGSGKSTFCTSMLTNLQANKRTAHLFNLDPAAESSSFEYEPSVDIRDLISLEDVMTELNYGPNGGLVYCFE